MSKQEKIEKLLRFLKRRDDDYFEPFCAALVASDQNGVLKKYFEKHRVCHYKFYDINDDYSLIVLNCCKGDEPSQWESPIVGPL